MKMAHKSIASAIRLERTWIAKLMAQSGNPINPKVFQRE